MEDVIAADQALCAGDPAQGSGYSVIANADPDMTRSPNVGRFNGFPPGVICAKSMAA